MFSNIVYFRNFVMVSFAKIQRDKAIDVLHLILFSEHYLPMPVSVDKSNGFIHLAARHMFTKRW